MSRNLKYIKCFEKYDYIDMLELGDLEKELEIIDSAFRSDPIEDLIECLRDLEDLRVSLSSNSFIPTLWKGSKLYQLTRRTLDGIKVDFLQTEDYLSDGKFHAEQTIHIYSELLQQILNVNGVEEFSRMLQIEPVKDHFISKVRWEARAFQEFLNEGWFISYGLHLGKKVNHPENKQDWIDTLYECQQNLKYQCNYEMILAGNTKDPYLMITHKDNIVKL